MSERTVEHTLITLPQGDALFQGECACGIRFGVIVMFEALDQDEYRPRFCPCCGKRATYQLKIGEVLD